MSGTFQWLSSDSHVSVVRPDSFADVLIVLVTYGQSPRGCTSIRSLDGQAAQIGHPVALLVYDNSAERAAPADIADGENWSVTYRHDPTNPGVSAGYRAGAVLARALGKRWLLFLDQDTHFASDALTRYADAMSRYPDATLFCPILKAGPLVISPCSYRWKRGGQLPDVRAGVREFDGVSVLNSGMCVTLDAYERSGGHDLGVPLDFSDHDFIARFQRIVGEFVVVGTVAEHGFSGTAIQSAEAARRRFRSYCVGAMCSSRTTTERIGSAALVFARAVLLAYRYRCPAFVWTALYAGVYPQVSRSITALTKPVE